VTALTSKIDLQKMSDDGRHSGFPASPFHGFILS